MFSLNDKVVYPGYGVARISRILVKKVGSDTTNFFELTFINKPMTILVPVSNAIMVGIRPLSSLENIDAVLKMLATIPASAMTHAGGETTMANWNRRNKEYQGKVRTGNLRDICEIYRDLKLIETTKGLSFGEKNLLVQTESLLAEEIAIVYNINEENATEQLRLVARHLQADIRSYHVEMAQSQ